MTRFFWQLLLILSLLLSSWWGMMVIHEAGHVVGALCTRGTIQHVELSPWVISRTDVSPNPSPLIVTWSGPIAGAAIPVFLWLAACRFTPALAPLLRFFAGFCLIANGAYLAIGSLERIGDAGDLLRHGAAAWQLWLFGIVCMSAGLWLWHGVGGSFGVGPQAKPVRRNVAVGTAAFALLLFACLAVCG